MATSDDDRDIPDHMKIQRFAITAGGAIEVNGSYSGGVFLETFDDDDDHSTIIEASPPECDALIAAISRALGRPPVTPAILDLARSIADLPEEESARMVARWKEARGEQGATVPRAGVEALRDELVDFQKRYVLGGMTETRVDRIVTMVDALLAAPATQTEKG